MQQIAFLSARIATHMRAAARPALAIVTVLFGLGSLVVLDVPASAATSFTAGDIVVYRVGTGGALASAGTAITLDEYSPSGGTPAVSVPLPTTAGGSNAPIVASGSASSEGLLTLSGNDQYLLASGYDDTVGASNPSSSSTVPRDVARIDGNENVNSSTTFNNFGEGNNVRSATSTDGSSIWIGSASSGVGYTTLGSTNSVTALNAVDTNVRGVQVFDGQLYASADPTKAGTVNVATVGSGTPTTAPQAITDFPGLPTTSFEPYGYVLVTLGTGTTPDTLYVAENTSGDIEKYTLSSGTWKASGSIAISGAAGTLSGLAADDTSGTVTIYATTPSTLYKATDSSGFGGTLSGSATAIATAGTNESFRGIAFAPGTVFGSGSPAAPTFSSANATTFDVGSAGTFAVTTNGTPTPALSETGSLPTGVTFTDNANGTATLAGTPATGTVGTYPLNITAANGVAPNAVQSFSLSVNGGAPPTISAAYAGLPAAIGDPTNVTMPVTVASSAFDPSQLTITATSSNTAVAASASVSTGGANRTLTVTPGTTVGDATITLTVTDPNNESATTTVAYGLSVAASDPSTARYYSGAGNGSTVIDVGGGYMLVGDDESNVLRLYQEGVSGPPVKTFDFTGDLPYGTTEIDIEAAAQSGNTIYWSGSMSNDSSGNVEPARSTLFATTVSGSGANTNLTFVGYYTGLRADLIRWDQANGNALNFAADAAQGANPKATNGFNMEGMEFAPDG
jgi:hypothetical protein